MFGDLRLKYNDALHETVTGLKARDDIVGIFTFGSYARGTLTPRSDLDVFAILEKEPEESRRIEVRNNIVVDIFFSSIDTFEKVFNDKEDSVIKIASIIFPLKTALIVWDPEKKVKTYFDKAKEYKWNPEQIDLFKAEALEKFDAVADIVDEGDTETGIHVLRQGVLALGKVVQMRNNSFDILTPSRTLDEVRIFSPLVYETFLRTFLLRGADADTLLDVSKEIKAWVDETKERIEKSDTEHKKKLFDLVLEAHDELETAIDNIYGDDTEMAMLQIQYTLSKLGKTLLLLEGIDIVDDADLIKELRKLNHPFLQVLLNQGKYQIQPREVKRYASEATFLAQRI